jgi:hypothetical protein
MPKFNHAFYEHASLERVDSGVAWNLYEIGPGRIETTRKQQRDGLTPILKQIRSEMAQCPTQEQRSREQDRQFRDQLTELERTRDALLHRSATGFR